MVNEWRDDNIDGDEYDGDHDDDEISRRAKRVPIVPLQLGRGNGIPVVEAVIKDNNEGATAEQEHPQPSTKRAPVPSTLPRLGIFLVSSVDEMPPPVPPVTNVRISHVK